MLFSRHERTLTSRKIITLANYSSISRITIMKWGLGMLLVLCLFACHSNNSKGADRVTAEEEVLSNEEKKPLIALGQLWGFLKYHHPAVAKGSYDWDMELMKIIPDVANAKKESEWKAILANWVDSLPAVPARVAKSAPLTDVLVKADYGVLFDTVYFEPRTIEKVKQILNNAHITTHHYVKSDGRGVPTFTNEQPYDEDPYPDYAHRLLSLYRYWNIINYFYPYRELCDQKWCEVLGDRLPDFVNARDKYEYMLACLRLVTLLDDSHAFFSSRKYPGILFEWAGVFKVPFETKFVEGQLVVTSYTSKDDKLKDKIKIGDVITKVDGDSVKHILTRLLPYTPASNYGVKLREIAKNVLRGNTSTVSLSISRGNESIEVEVERRFLGNLDLPDYYNTQPGQKGYKIREDGIGYIFPANAKIEERDQIPSYIQRTKGLIVDLRCYPDDFFESKLMDYLNKTNVEYSEVSHGNFSYPGYFFMKRDAHKASFMPDVQNTYKYKVVVIVNEYTQSRAENTVMRLQTSPLVTVIGSTTAGADGHVVSFDLPGGIQTSITSLGVYYPDGADTQRVGIKIDEFVQPTIQGIRDGRDELLERAVQIIKEP